MLIRCPPFSYVSTTKGGDPNAELFLKGALTLEWNHKM